jgi:3-dehydroquinate synthase
MKTIKVNLGKRSYPIIIGAPLSGIGAMLRRYQVADSVLLITNTTVGRLYAGEVVSGLRSAGFRVSVATIKDGEKFKTLETVGRLYGECVKARLERGSAIVALGGGVVGDIAGFVAATFMRGVPFAQIPTTLLAMVDSSVGGKTGVNLEASKNLVGAFYQPKFVYCDPGVLKTLPQREISCGLAEIIKYGVIADEKFFRRLEKNVTKIAMLEPAAVNDAVFTCCSIKSRIVSLDETEAGVRAVLNFGHTIGHALEAITEYKKYSHGEAVSVGMACAARISEKLGLCPHSTVERLENLLVKAALPVSHSLDVNRVFRLLAFDKKVKNGKIRMVLPADSIGKTVIRDDVPSSTIKLVLREVKI